MRRTLPGQVIRNISMWTFQAQEAMENPQQDYRERTLWEPFVEPLLDLATETESHDLLVEVSCVPSLFTFAFFLKIAIQKRTPDKL